MPYLSPRDRARRQTRRLAVTLVVCCMLLILTLLDQPAVAWFRLQDPLAEASRALALAYEPEAARGLLANSDSAELSKRVQRLGLESRDWWHVLRSVGTLTTWLIVGLLLSLASRLSVSPERRRHAPHLGLALVLATALAGLAAELLKVALRRNRPGPSGDYTFGWATEPLGLDLSYGLASSHAAVAFAAAWFLGRLWPTTRVPLLLLAALCALTRLLAGAHYLTDVYVGALFGLLSAEALWRAGLSLGTLSPWRVRSGVTL